MGEPGCGLRPPSLREPVSIGAKPMSSISFDTVAFASRSSHATKIVKRSSICALGLPFVLRCSYVLNALTRRELGICFNTSSRDVLSPRSITSKFSERLNMISPEKLNTEFSTAPLTYLILLLAPLLLTR